MIPAKEKTSLKDLSCCYDVVNQTKEYKSLNIN